MPCNLPFAPLRCVVPGSGRARRLRRLPAVLPLPCARSRAAGHGRVHDKLRVQHDVRAGREAKLYAHGRAQEGKTVAAELGSSFACTAQRATGSGSKRRN